MPRTKKKGNNGKFYQSVPDKNNVYKWIIVKDEKDKKLGMKGTIDDFINLFQNIDFSLQVNPKTLKKTKEYMEFINDTNLKTIFDLPKIFHHKHKYTETL